MRTFAEERRSGTIEMLMTKPITDLQVILAKYFAGVVLVIFSLLPTLIYFISVNYLSSTPYKFENYFYIAGGLLISIVFLEIIILNKKLITIITASLLSLRILYSLIRLHFPDIFAWYLLSLAIILVLTLVIDRKVISKLIITIQIL